MITNLTERLRNAAEDHRRWLRWAKAATSADVEFHNTAAGRLETDGPGLADALAGLLELVALHDIDEDHPAVRLARGRLAAALEARKRKG